MFKKLRIIEVMHANLTIEDGERKSLGRGPCAGFKSGFRKEAKNPRLRQGIKSLTLVCQTESINERGFISGFMKSGMELLNIREMVKNIGGKFSVLWIND